MKLIVISRARALELLAQGGTIRWDPIIAKPRVVAADGKRYAMRFDTFLALCREKVITKVREPYRCTTSEVYKLTEAPNG